MPLELQIIRASEFIRLGAHGRLDLAASRDILRQLAAACQRRGIDRALLDLRDVHPGTVPMLTPQDLVSLVKTFCDIGFSDQLRLAVLYSTDPFHRARMFALMSTLRGRNVKACGNFEEAVLWLSKGERAESRKESGKPKIPVAEPKSRRLAEEKKIPIAATKPKLKPRPAGKTRGSTGLTLLLMFAIAAPLFSVQAGDDAASEYRGNLAVHHPIVGNLSGASHFEYRNNSQEEFQAYEVLWPGVVYSVTHWFQIAGGLTTRYTDNEQKADTLELRPFGGVKFFLPNKIEWSFYNYTRYEYRDTQDLETHNWSAYSRVRNQVGVEFPLTSRAKAWQPKTWYGLANVEPIYRFDTERIDPVYLRGGIGYVLSDRVRLEFVYSAEFARSNGVSLQHTDNIFKFNLNIGLEKGLLQRLLNPHTSD